MENTPAPNQQAPAAECPRVYRGNLANQKDQHAQNAWRAPKRGQGKPSSKLTPKTAPAELPPPTRR